MVEITNEDVMKLLRSLGEEAHARGRAEGYAYALHLVLKRAHLVLDEVANNKMRAGLHVRVQSFAGELKDIIDRYESVVNFTSEEDSHV